MNFRANNSNTTVFTLKCDYGFIPRWGAVYKQLVDKETFWRKLLEERILETGLSSRVLTGENRNRDFVNSFELFL